MRSLVLTLAALLALAAGLAALLGCAVEASVDEPTARSFEITYRAVVADLPPAAERLAIWLPYPTDDDAQEVAAVEVSSPYPTRIETEPELGNTILFVEAEGPFEDPITLELTARVRRTEKLRKDFGKARNGGGDRPAEVARWLEPDLLVPLDERIRTLAAEVTEGRRTDLDRARAIYDYVVDTMSYDKSGEGWGRGDIYWACDMKRGNCTDFHALFTGLNRAVGIPAKFAIGLPLPPERGEGEIGGYHCWAEFWLDGYGWVPVDTSEARKDPSKRDYFFGAHDENRIELSEGRDLVLAPPQNGDPLNFFVYPHVEVDGKPWGGVSQTFSFRDLEGADGQPAS